MRVRQVVLVLVLTLTFGGCAYLVRPPDRDPPVPRRFPPSVDLFSYERLDEEKVIEKILESESEKYQIFRIRLPLEEPLEAHYFKSKLYEKNRLIIVPPLYGKHELPAEMLVAYLTTSNFRADFNVLYIQERINYNLSDAFVDDPFDLDVFAAIKTEEELVTTARESVERTHKAVVGIRHLLDWAEREPSVDMQRVGIVGLSTAALLVTVAMATDARIETGAIVFGGGNLHEVFAYAPEPRLTKARIAVLQSSGKTVEEFAALLRGLFIDIEPVRYAWALHRSRIIYLDAAFDEFFPKSGRDALWEALDRPLRITFSYRHRPAFISMTPLGLNRASRKIIEFFRRTP